MVSTNEEVLSEVAPVELPVDGKTITEEDFERAQKLFQQGKKNLFLNKYDEAVNNFGDACKIYASKFGEMDPKCAEIYFFYGRALLELARIENTVLGNALSGVPEETEPINDSRYGNPEDVAAEEKQEISEKVIDALCSAEETAKPTEGEAAPTTTEECKPAETEQPATTEEVKETGETVAEGEEEEEEEGDEVEEETAETAEGENKEDSDDISNLQSSWEMFELAKVIYTKNFGEDQLFQKKRVAECLLKLGEISIEQEIYDQAVTDISESIKTQEEVESTDRDERMLAESYYQLGLARQFNNQFTDANEAYQRCINIVQLRIEKLRGKLLSIGDNAELESERVTINDEITELEALLPEMTSKLEEVNEQGQQTLNLIKEAKECFASTAAEAKPNGACSADVKDITSLVKSKRKIENDECTTTKKTRLSGEGCEEGACEKIEVDENKENKVVPETCGGKEATEVIAETGNNVSEQPTEPVA